MERREHEGLPWARTWMALAVASVVIGVLFAVMPYQRATLVLEGDQSVTLRCAPPVVGAFGADEWPDEPADEVQIDQDCPRQARGRLLSGTALVLGGIAGVVVLRRVRGPRPRRPQLRRRRPPAA